VYKNARANWTWVSYDKEIAEDKTSIEVYTQEREKLENEIFA